MPAVGRANILALLIEEVAKQSRLIGLEVLFACQVHLSLKAQESPHDPGIAAHLTVVFKNARRCLKRFLNKHRPYQEPLVDREGIEIEIDGALTDRQHRLKRPVVAFHKIGKRLFIVLAPVVNKGSQLHQLIIRFPAGHRLPLLDAAAHEPDEQGRVGFFIAVAADDIVSLIVEAPRNEHIQQGRFVRSGEAADIDLPQIRIEGIAQRIVRHIGENLFSRGAAGRPGEILRIRDLNERPDRLRRHRRL